MISHCGLVGYLFFWKSIFKKMGQKAISIDEQIQLLHSRGIVINNEEKAKEVLFDVGYFRLGFYWFPFELTYPQKDNRNHQFKQGSNFDDAVKLYYFDFKLRNYLLKALSRIEIAFRTKVIYLVSNQNPDKPTWFADPSVVQSKQAKEFKTIVYDKLVAKNISVIAMHHRHHINDVFAPAWKTMEFMTIGEVLHLFKSIKDDTIKSQVAAEFNIKQLVTFNNYMEVIKNVRNVCAHSNVLYDFTPERSIRKGPAMFKGIGANQNLNGALHVVLYMLKQVSVNRFNELKEDIEKLINDYSKYPKIAEILRDVSGLKIIL